MQLVIGILSLLFSLATTPSIPQETPLPSSPPLESTISVPVDSPTPQPLSYTVVSVTDGDTFKVSVDDATKTVRIIGIDTPETKDPRKAVQCFGSEATEATKQLLLNQKVFLEADPLQADLDKYQRLLRYVRLEDGTDVGLNLIENGFASEYTYQTPHERQAEYRAAQQQAQTQKKGLWSDTACLATPAPTSQSTPRPVVTPTALPVAPLVTPKPVQNSGFSCNCSKTCPNMGCAEAQYQLNVCGCSARDADKDGIACDAQCQ